jgi:hypothetical protein
MAGVMAGDERAAGALTREFSRQRALHCRQCRTAEE